MKRFLLSLLNEPEAQQSPHYWAAVLASHIAIGYAVWICLLVITKSPMIATNVALILYAGFELRQVSIAARQDIFWDSILDWVIFATAIMSVENIWFNDIWDAFVFMLVAFLILLVGVYKRVR